MAGVRRDKQCRHRHGSTSRNAAQVGQAAVRTECRSGCERGHKARPTGGLLIAAQQVPRLGPERAPDSP